MGRIGDLLKRAGSECWQFAREIKASAIGEEMTEKIRKRLFESSRPQIMKAIRELPQEEDRRVLFRRLDEAENVGQEDSIIICLTSIPPEDLQATLEWLARMEDDKEFSQAIEVLHHDPAAQWWTRQKVKAREMFRGVVPPLKKGAGASGACVADVLSREADAARGVLAGLRGSTAERKARIARLRQERQLRQQRPAACRDSGQEEANS